MASTLVKLYVHLIFHVRSNSVKMKEEDLPRIFAYIGGIIRNANGTAIEIGGRTDHLHILCSMPKTMSLADLVRSIKTNSHKWLKELEPYYLDFAWQEGYGAFSVSQSQLDKTIKYIQRQEEHHRQRSFQEEYKLFLQAYGIEYNEQYAFAD